MDDFQEARELIIESILKSGSVNSINAHFLSLVTKALNGKLPKKSNLGQLLTPIKQNSSLSNEIANEIVFDFFERFSLNYSLSTIENETKKTVSRHHDTNWILEKLKFTNEKDTPINQLIHQHDTNEIPPQNSKEEKTKAGPKPKNRITKGTRKKPKNVPTISRKPINNDSQSSIDILGSSAVPTGISKNEWEERKLRTMESQSEESSTVNLSDLQPQYTIDSFGNNVQRAIGELVYDQDFDNMHDSSSSKPPRQSGNQRQGDSLQSAFSESAKENERKKDMIQTFESDSKEIEEKLNNDLKDQLHSSSSNSKKKTIKKSKKNVFDKMSQSSVQNLSEVPLTQMSSDYLRNATQDHLLNITKQESSGVFLSENSSSKEYSEKSSHKSSSKRSNNLHEAPVLDEDNYQNQKDALAETFKPKEVHVDNSFEDQQIEEEEESDNEINHQEIEEEESDDETDHQEIEQEELESDDESGLKKLSTGPSEEEEKVDNNASSIVGILGKSAMENAKDESDHKDESSINSSELNGEEEDVIFLSEESPLPQGERNDQSPLPQSDSDIQSPSQHLSSQLSKSAHSASQNEHIAQSQHSGVQPGNQSAKSSVLETSSQYSKQFYSSSTEKENPLFENIRNVILVSTESEYSSEESENEHKLVSDDSKSKSSQRDLRIRPTKSENQPAVQPNPKQYKFKPTIEITNVADFPYHSSRHSAVSRDIEEFNTVSKSLDKDNKSSVISEPQSSVVSEVKSSVVSKQKSEKPDEQEYSSASYERQSIKSKKSKSSSRISHHSSKVQQKQPEVNNKEESQAIDFSDEESEFTRDFNNIDMSPWTKPTKFIKKHNDSDSEIDTIIDTIAGSPSPSKTPKHLIRKSTPQQPKEEAKKEIEDESYEYESSSYSKASSHPQSISNSRHSSAIESNTKPSKVNNKSESSSIKSYSKRSNNQQPIQNRKDKSESLSMKSNSKQSTASNQPIERNQLESSSIHSTARNQKQSRKDKLESSSIQSFENSQSRKDKLDSSSIKSNSKQSTASNQIVGRNKSESASVKSIASNKQNQPINNRKDKSESSSIKSDSIVSDHQPVKQNQPIKTSVARSESSSSRSSLSPIESKSNSQVEIKQKSRDNSILSNQKSEYSIHDELSNIESYSNAFSQEYKSTKVQPKQQITKPVVVEDENTIDNDEFIEEEEKSSEVVKPKPSTQVAKPSSLSKKKATSYNNKPKQQQQKKSIPAKPAESSKHSSVIEQKPIKQVNEQPKKEVQRYMDISFDEEFENENQIEEEAENEVQLSKIEEEHQLNVPSEILNGNQSSPLTESESDSPEIPNTGEQISPHVFKRPMIMNQYTLNQPSNLRRVQRNVSFTNEDSDIDSNQFGGNLADPFNRKAKKLPKVEKKPPSPVPSQTTEASSSAYESNFSFEYANTKSKKAAPKPQSGQNSSMSKKSSGVSENSSFDQSHDFSSVFEQVKSKQSKKTAVNAHSKESSDIIDRSIDIESTSNHISEIDEEPKKEPILKSSLKNKPKSKYQPVSHSPYSITSSRKAPSTNRIVSPYSQFPEDNLSVNSLANKNKDVQYDAMSFSEFFDTVVNDNRSQNREIRQPGIVDKSGLQSSSTASVVSNHLSDFSSESLFSKEFKEAKVVRFHHPKVQSEPKSEEASQASIESVQKENEQQPNEEQPVNEEEQQIEEELQNEEEQQNEVEPHNEEEQFEEEQQIEEELQNEEEETIEVEQNNEEEQFEEEEIGEVHQIEEEQLIEEVHQIEQPVEEVEIEEEESSSSDEIIPPPKEIKESNIVQPNNRTTQNNKNEKKDQPVVKRAAVIKEDSSFSSQSGFSEEFDQNKKKILRPISHKTEKFTLKPKQEVQQKPQVRSSNSSQISEPNSSSCFSDVFTKTKTKQSKPKVTKPNAEHSANSIISDILSNDISSKQNSNEPSINSETSSFSNNFEKAKPSKTKKRVHKKTTSSHSSVVSNNDNQPKDQNQSKNDEQSFSNVFTETTNKKPKAKKQFINDKKKPEDDSTISSIVSENSRSQKDDSSNLQDPKKFDDENSLSSIHKASNMSPENSMKSYSSDQFAFTPKTKGPAVKPQNEIVPPRAKIQPKKQVDDSKKKVAQPTNNQKKEIALTIDVSLNSLDNEDLQFDIPSPTDQKREFNSDLDKKEGSNKEIEVISDLSINSGFMNDSLLSNDGKDANEKKKTTTKKVNTGKTFGKSNVKTLGKDNGSNIDVVIELDDNSEY